MKKCLSAAFILFLIHCNSVSANSIILAVPEAGYPPYIVVNGSNVTGIMPEILFQAANKYGYSLQFQFSPENRSLLLLKNGKVDARMESPAWIDNPGDFYWSEPVVEITDHFVFNNQTPNYFENDKQLSGAEIVTHLGYGYPTLQKLFEEKTIKRKDYRTEIAMLDSLMRKAFEAKRAAVMDRHVAMWLIKNNPRFKDKLSFSKRVVDRMPLHFQFSKNDKLKRFVFDFNNYIDQIRKDGKMHEIIMESLNY